MEQNENSKMAIKIESQNFNISISLKFYFKIQIKYTIIFKIIPNIRVITNMNRIHSRKKYLYQFMHNF